MEKFWETLSLEQMSTTQWESLCDGCALCCLVKLQCDETNDVYYTDVACQYLSLDQCRCKEYPRRETLAPDCLRLDPAQARNTGWLPNSCAYRRLAEGRGLPEWHPLISGSSKTVHTAGVSVLGRVVSENSVQPDDLEDRIVFWVNEGDDNVD